MGQEWSASAPFQYFTDHDRDLGWRIAVGRRAEFAKFRGFSDPTVRQGIPDPQDPATFQRSKLDWGELQSEKHQRVWKMYRDLLQLRRHDPVLASASRDGLRADACGKVLRVMCWHREGRRLLLLNLSPEPATLDSGLTAPIGTSTPPRALFSTHPAGSGQGLLPGHAALIFAAA
jgi:maltooligosyltrehalose trehalohydrolase